MKVLIPLLILITPFFSCKKENRGDCFKGTGEIYTEIRNTDNFDSIYVQNNINVFITIDTVREIKVEAGKNLLPKIITKVENGKLFISNSNRCNFVRSFKNEITVSIKLPAIKGIETEGDGVIKSTNTITNDTIDIKIKNTGDVDLRLDVKYVLTHIHGSGDVILSGIAASHNVQVSGTCFIRCSGLITDHTFLWANTTGDAFLSATKTLNAIIVGSGNVYYSGNPDEVKNETIGSGQLVEEK